MGAADALSLVAEVARAIAAGLADNVEHGRLRPSSVFITDAGEVRIRGLAVDAALFGPTSAVQSGRSGDVDALGSLTYQDRRQSKLLDFPVGSFRLLFVLERPELDACFHVCLDAIGCQSLL